MNKPLSQLSTDSLKKIDPDTLKVISDTCFLAGFASIIGSIIVWGAKRSDGDVARAERFGIFVGLWAPTFFILSNRFERYAERASESK